MSRSAHAQHPFKLRKLPRCTRCKMEFMLIAVKYDNVKDVVYEWECQKCHKAVPQRLLKEEPLSEWDSFLQEKVKEENEKHKGKRDSKKTN